MVHNYDVCVIEVRTEPITVLIKYKKHRFFAGMLIA